MSFEQEILEQATKHLAYDLADNLRSKYMNNTEKIPENETKQAVEQLQQQFNLTLEQAEHALAQGFFESR